MRRIDSGLALAGLGFLLCLSIPLSAKGPTVRVITGADLPQPVEVTAPALLQQFQVWSGPGVEADGQQEHRGFIIDWVSDGASRRSANLPRYKVSFYAKYANRPLDSQPQHLAYVVWYEPDFSSRRGYVYLPGKGDEAFALNVQTIFRGREGRWFDATDTWNAAVLDRLARQSRK